TQEALLGSLLASSSMGDLGDLLATGQIVAQSNVDLATRVANVKAERAFKTADLNTLRSQQVQLIAQLAAERSSKARAIADPLADPLSMPSSTTFNPSGVQDYVSLDQGLQATRYTLVNGAGLGYGAILSELAGCADPMSTARAISASMWCRGCVGGAYVVND